MSDDKDPEEEVQKIIDKFLLRPKEGRVKDYRTQQDRELAEKIKVRKGK